MRDPPTSASLPQPATTIAEKPHGGSGSAGRHTGRTDAGYVLAVNAVRNLKRELKVQIQSGMESNDEIMKIQVTI